MYNWQQHDWPNFTYDTLQIKGLLYDFVGWSTGLLDVISEESKKGAIVELS